MLFESGPEFFHSIRPVFRSTVKTLRLSSLQRVENGKVVDFEKFQRDILLFS